MVTGANSGIGKELAKILYAKHARVYVTARSREKGTQTVDDIKKEVISSNGDIIFIPLDLSDLEHTKQAARQILDKERKIHLLFNNAGVMVLSEEQRTVQGYEQQLGVNNVATHLFTKLLTPALIHTAQLEPPGTVRVIWVASSAAETPQSPKGGVPMDNLDYHEKTDGFAKYAISKAGVYFQGAEFARRHRADGVISIPLHPGILNTELFRTAPGLIQRIFKVVFTYPPIYGAYTEIFAGFSPDVTLERSGDWGKLFSLILIAYARQGMQKKGICTDIRDFHSRAMGPLYENPTRSQRCYKDEGGRGNGDC